VSKEDGEFLGKRTKKVQVLTPAQVEAFLESAEEGFVCCVDGEIVWANVRAAEILRRDPQASLLGLEFDELFLRTEEGREISDRLIRFEDGEERRVLVRELDSGEDQLLYILDEVSEERSLQHEVQRAHRELYHANRERVALRERVQVETEERDELLSVVSHELRTPITVITGYNRLLLSEKIGPLNDGQRRFCEQSIRSCQRLNTFITNLLEASRESNGEMVLEVHESSLIPVISSVISFLKPLIEEHELSIEVDLPPEQSVARFDPVRIEQVITNLLNNAIKYTRRGSRLEVSLRRIRSGDRDFVETTVADNGPGIAKEDRERVFDPYVRLGDAGEGGGLGLGLALCRRIVEAHSGTIRVEERQGGGCRFIFLLPAGAGDASLVSSLREEPSE